MIVYHTFCVFAIVLLRLLLTKKSPYGKIIYGDDMEIKIKYSKRRTMSLEITRECEILVRAPLNAYARDVEKFVKTHEEWLILHLEKKKASLLAHPEPTKDELTELKALAKEYIPERVAYFSSVMGIIPESVSINSAKGRFGSCSSKNRLNFSCRLMAYDKDAIDYVVVHELAHIKHHDHSRNFWALVEKYMPDYKERKELLR